jgi:hypothetical protein
MEGGAKVLVTAVGLHSQTGIIMSLLGATDHKEKETNKEKKNYKKGIHIQYFFKSLQCFLRHLRWFLPRPTGI